MVLTMLRRGRVYRHAADGVGDAMFGSRAVVVMFVCHNCLETNTP
jgi:hypothetical protein